MDLRHVRTFVAVVEAGSVSKAALLLRIAQPALSRQIGDLEKLEPEFLFEIADLPRQGRLRDAQ